jgi:hypothetical protein
MIQGPPVFDIAPDIFATTIPLFPIISPCDIGYEAWVPNISSTTVPTGVAGCGEYGLFKLFSAMGENV